MSVRRPSTQYTPNHRRNERDVASNWKSGQIREDERPVDRFFKDAAAGALRGMFYEMYRFWQNFRIR